MWSPSLILAAAAWAGPRVLVEVDLGPLDPAPVAEVASGTERVELSCRDDGQGADAQANDAVHTCAGQAPQGATRLSLRWAGGTESVEGAIDEDLSLRLGPEGFGPLQPRLVPPEPTQPSAGPNQPEPGKGQGWWGLLLGLLAAAGVGLWLWPRGLRGATWTAAELRRQGGDLEQVYGALTGPTLVAGGGDLPGPVLRSESLDVDHLLSVLHGMRKAHPALPLNLLILDAQALTAPGEIGLSAVERLLREAPAGTNLVIWEP